jgi:competence protein ComEA
MFKKLLAAVLAFCAAAAFAAVDVNKADAAALDTVKGIGPAIAGNILEERKKGNFKNWDDLIARVPGIGEASAAKFSEGGLRVNGRTFRATAAAAKKDDKSADAKPAPKDDKKADAKAPAKDEKKAEAKAPAKDEKKAEAKAAPKDDKKAEKKDEKK